MDHINITLNGSESVVGIALKYSDDIAGDTLADSISSANPVGYVKEWDINGEAVNIGVEKI